jgi:hypothetical protein
VTNYRRNFIRGGSFFFTANLAERRLRLHVSRVRDWPYSSFHRMVRFGVYPLDWAGDAADNRSRFGER